MKDLYKFTYSIIFLYTLYAYMFLHLQLYILMFHIFLSFLFIYLFIYLFHFSYLHYYLIIYFFFLYFPCHPFLLYQFITSPTLFFSRYMFQCYLIFLAQYISLSQKKNNKKLFINLFINEINTKKISIRYSCREFFVKFS